MLLEMARSGTPERVALTCGGEQFTYEALHRAALAAGRELREAGQERAALLDVTSPAVPVLLFGAAAAGVPFVPLNYRLTGAELDRLLAEVAPATVVTDAARAARLAGGKTPGLRPLARDAFLEAVRSGEEAEPAATDPDAIAVLLFTSGTTGPPKAAVLRHRHLVSYILGSVEFGAAREDEATLVSVPPYHVAGIAAILSSVYAGRRIVQLSSFDAGAWIDLARRERVSHAFVVPTMLARIVDELERRGERGPETLRALSYGGGKMPLPVIEKAMALFPEAGFTNAYGLTETSSTLTVLTPEDHRQAAASADPGVRRRLVSVGRPLPGIELEVRDASGKPCGPGERGEIHVRGEQVSGEYLGREPRLLEGGWFPTRDGGFLDEEGYLFVEGRIDDVIVRGGENLSPGEIEDTLLAHPAVADCAVVGVPDTQWGEAVAAAVVPAPGARVEAAELQRFVRDRLRSSRMPQHVFFLSELPYNETGKLLRRVIREELAARLAPSADRGR